MQETVGYLRSQHETDVHIRNELGKKNDELRKLQSMLEDTQRNLNEKNDQIKELENHFVVRR